MSPLARYGYPLNISGGMKPGVPDLFINSRSLMISAKPKSINFI